MYKLKRLWIAVAAAAAVAVVVAAPATAASPHPFGPVQGDLCGVSGYWSGSGLENATAGNVLTYESTNVFTAQASGTSVTFHNAGVITGYTSRVDNGDGTYSMLYRSSGTFSVKLVNGPILFAGGGTSIQADVYDSATNQYITTTFVWAPPTHRPTVGNPCDVIVPALT